MAYKIKLTGIYIIEIGEYYYIGKSVDVFSRWQSHYTLLKQGTHHSKELQSMFSRVGVVGTTFRVLEYISITEFKKSHQFKGKELKLQFSRHLDRAERECMKSYSVNFCLNADKKYFS
jgi:hypothetical protein